MFAIESLGVESLLALLLNVSFKSILLAVTVWITLKLFRVNSVTVKHRVWTLVLGCMLVLPGIVLIAPVIGVPVTWLSDPSPINAEAVRLPTVAVLQEPLPQPAIPEISPNVVLPIQDLSPVSSVPIIEDAAFPSLPVESPSAAPEASMKPVPVGRSWSLFALGGLYALGVALLLTRIIVGFVHSRRMIHQARSIDLPACEDGSPKFDRIMESDHVLVPLTLGLWRPAVILPADWHTWDASVVQVAVAHEAEHVRRRDTWVLLATTLNAAVYWFHPLAWLLRWHINELAEQACDDEVIRTTGQRTTYAQILVDMASRLASGAARYQPTGIGMGAKPIVEERVNRILDDGRPLATRVGWFRSLLLASLIATVAIVTGGLSAVPVANAAPNTDAAGTGSKPATKEPAPVTRAPVEPAVEEPRQKTLDPETHTVTGKVVMPDGTPVADAEVRLMSWRANNTKYSTKTAQTNTEGEFLFEGLADGKHRIAAYVYAQDLSSRTKRYQGETVDVKGEPLLLKLQKVPAMKVKVVSAETQQPIPNARVRLTWTDTERDHSTDANGQVALRGLTPEAWTIEVQAKGYAEQVHTLNLTGAETGEVQAILEPGAELSGVVRDEAGDVVPQAGVSVFPSDHSGGQIEYMKTNAKGEYHFEYLPINGLRLLVSKDDYQPLQQNVVMTVAAGKRQRQDITLAKRPDGGSVQGTVVDTNGKPIAGAEISNHGNSSRDQRKTTTEIDGSFRLDNVFRSYRGHQLTVEASGYAPQQIRFTPGPQAKPGQVSITLKPGRKLFGTVVDEKGQPLKDVRVVADRLPGSAWGARKNTKTDGKGQFALDSLTTDTFLEFSKSGYSVIQNKLLPPDRDDVTITLLSEGVIRGKVVDDETGKPVSPFKVQITFSPDREPDDPSTSIISSRVDPGETFVVPNGMFRLDALTQKMPLQVTVVADGYLRSVRRRIVATTDKDAKTVEFRLKKIDKSDYLSVSGQLLNEDRNPVPGVQLRLIVAAKKRPFPRDKFPFNWEMITSGQVKRTDNVLQFLKTTSNADGRFAFPKVFPGQDIELVYWGGGVSRSRLPGIASLEPAQRSNLVVNAVAAGSVRGIIDAEKYPDISQVALSGRSGIHRGGAPKSDGSYEVRNIPPGEYQLQLYGPSTPISGSSARRTHVVKRIPVTVESGKTLMLNIGSKSKPPLQPKKKTEPALSSTVDPESKVPVTSAAAVKTPVNDNADIVITGRVTDEAGKSVAGAKLWILKHPFPDDTYQEATTDSEGNYSLFVPSGVAKPGSTSLGSVVWCHAAGRQIAAASAYGQIKRTSEKPVDFILQPASDTGFIVKTTDGTPVAGALVEPLHFRVGSYDIIPRPIREMIAATSDKNGRASLPAVGRDRLFTVQVTAAGYGIQQLRLKDSADAPAIRTFVLRPTGRLEGKLISDKPEAIRNARFYVYQEDFLGEHSSATALVKTDEEGRFVVPELAEGAIELVPSVPDNSALPLRPRVPSGLQIHAGDTTKVEITYEPTVRIRGRVQTKTDARPVAGGLVYVSYGSFRQGQQVLTDADGRFEVLALPGQVRQQLIARPDAYRDWSVERAGWQNPVNVPKNVETYDLPTLELIQNQRRVGRLLDFKNEPVAGMKVSAISGNRVYSMAPTDEQGNFSLAIPDSVKIEKFRVHPESGGAPLYATVVEESPLVLQLPAE